MSKRSIIEKIKEINWDNDVIRLYKDFVDGKVNIPIQFSYDRTVNSILEVLIELITEKETADKRISDLESKVSALQEKLSNDKKD